MVRSKKYRAEKFTPEIGWHDIDTRCTDKVSFVANNQMHLNIEQVKNLIPVLLNFVKTGDNAVGLPVPERRISKGTRF